MNHACLSGIECRTSGRWPGARRRDASSLCRPSISLRDHPAPSSRNSHATPCDVLCAASPSHLPLVLSLPQGPPAGHRSATFPASPGMPPSHACTHLAHKMFPSAAVHPAAQVSCSIFSPFMRLPSMQLLPYPHPPICPAGFDGRFPRRGGLVNSPRSASYSAGRRGAQHGARSRHNGCTHFPNRRGSLGTARVGRISAGRGTSIPLPQPS